MRRLYKSKLPDVHIPDDLSLTELLLSSARSPPVPETQIIAKDTLEQRTLTLGELRDSAGRLAQGLTGEYRPRDQSRWALVLPNCVTILEAFHAVLWLGGVACPINHQLKAGEIAHALSVSNPQYIIVYSQVVEKVVEAVGIAKSKAGDGFVLPKIITAVDEASSRPHSYPFLRSFLATERLPVVHHRDTRTRLGSIHLSSGTTGNPKGVGLSHYNYIACCLQLFGHDPAQWTPENKVVTYTPYVHLANGTIPFFLGPWTGMMHVILPDGDNLKIAEAVQYNKATSVQVYAGLAVAMLETDLLERYDFSTVKYIVTGGLPFDEQGYKKFHTLGDWQTICVYGMTESAAWAAYQRVGEVVPQGKIGTLLPNMVGQLRTASGEDAPDGGPGELWLKGPNMTLGYVDNPEANKTAFDSEGWYNTGDICTFDGNGYIQLVGRTKELMKVSGFQVSPNELERYAYVHPAVVDIGVGPVYDKKRHTEVPAAYVVLKPHLTTDEEKIDALKNIQSLVDSQVSGYKKLRGGVWEVTSLPRNATHKLLRRNIADQKTGLSSLDSQKLSAKL